MMLLLAIVLSPFNVARLGDRYGFGAARGGVWIAAYESKHAMEGDQRIWYRASPEIVRPRLFFRIVRATGGEDYYVFIPIWFVALVLGAIYYWLRPLRTIKRTIRAERGLCSQCGYDIKACIERCSECGTDLSPLPTLGSVCFASGDDPIVKALQRMKSCFFIYCTVAFVSYLPLRIEKWIILVYENVWLAFTMLLSAAAIRFLLCAYEARVRSGMVVGLSIALVVTAFVSRATNSTLELLGGTVHNGMLEVEWILAGAATVSVFVSVSAIMRLSGAPDLANEAVVAGAAVGFLQPLGSIGLEVLERWVTISEADHAGLDILLEGCAVVYALFILRRTVSRLSI